MNDAATGMTLRLELFVDDLAASVDFYTRVLGFTKEHEEAVGYADLVNGAALISLHGRKKPRDPALGRAGQGVEITLDVDDVFTFYARVEATGWPLLNALTAQSWGQTDFRVADPDGYRLRVTSRA